MHYARLRATRPRMIWAAHSTAAHSSAHSLPPSTSALASPSASASASLYSGSSSLPAPVPACRHHMALLRCEPTTRQALQALCGTVAGRLAAWRQWQAWDREREEEGERERDRRRDEEKQREKAEEGMVEERMSECETKDDSRTLVSAEGVSMDDMRVRGGPPSKWEGHTSSKAGRGRGGGEGPAWDHRWAWDDFSHPLVSEALERVLTCHYNHHDHLWNLPHNMAYQLAASGKQTDGPDGREPWVDSGTPAAAAPEGGPPSGLATTVPGSADDESKAGKHSAHHAGALPELPVASALRVVSSQRARRVAALQQRVACSADVAVCVDLLLAALRCAGQDGRLPRLLVAAVRAFREADMAAAFDFLRFRDMLVRGDATCW